MPGKLCNGVTGYTTGEIRNSRAFCEGYQARAESGSPVDPHVTGSEASVSWLAGVQAKANEVAGGENAGCCAPTPTGP